MIIVKPLKILTVPQVCDIHSLNLSKDKPYTAVAFPGQHIFDAGGKPNQPHKSPLGSFNENEAFNEV